MNLLMISNLLPRPDQQTHGMFNVQLSAALGRISSMENICLIPEWRPLKWRRARQWGDEFLPVPYVPLVGRAFSGWTYGLSLRKIEDRIRDVDAVIVPWLYPDGVAVAGTAQDTGTPLWIMVLGSDVFHLRCPLRRKQILGACGKAAGIICVAQHLADRLADAGVERKKLHVVPNGVDSALFKYRPSSAEEQRTVLFVGNLVPVKGPDIMLRAWVEFLRVVEWPALRSLGEAGSSSRVVLAVIGDGPMRSKLECLAGQLGVVDSVRFLGSLPHEEVARWMNDADCFCLTSRSEGMPNVVIEALASGLPVVAANVGACAEMLEGEPYARLVNIPQQPNNPATQQLASAMAEIMALDVDREAMAQRNAGRFSWDKMAGEILKLIGTSQQRTKNKEQRTER